MTSAWQKYKEKLGTTRPWDMLNPNASKVDDSISEHRMALCKKCPELLPITNQCKQCGCFMAAKVKLEAATCPLNKW
jgi:hypothetical protein